MQFDLPPVDLVLITYGNREMCEQNIQNILDNTEYPQFFLTVIDNHSLDDTWQGVCETLYRYPNVRGLQTHKNVGYGQACNLGSIITQSPILVFLNSDVSVREGNEDWLHPIVDELVDNEDIGVCAPKLVNKENQLMGTGVRGTNKERFIAGWLEEDTGEYDTPCDVLSICGAALAVKRDIFNMYGGFLPLYQHYFEEEDFCWTIRKEGLRVRYQPDSVLIHDHMGSCEDQELLGQYATQGQAIFNSRWGEWMEEDSTEYPQNEGE